MQCNLTKAVPSNLNSPLTYNTHWKIIVVDKTYTGYINIINVGAVEFEKSYELLTTVVFLLALRFLVYVDLLPCL